MSNSHVISGGNIFIATDAIEEDGKEFHYNIVVLRDDQLDRIAKAVADELERRRLVV